MGTEAIARAANVLLSSVQIKMENYPMTVFAVLILTAAAEDVPQKFLRGAELRYVS